VSENLKSVENAVKTTKEPTIITHLKSEDASGQVRVDFAEALAAKKWMCAIWTVGKDGIPVCKKTTWDFPTNKLRECVKELQNAVDKELGNAVLTPEALPFADFLPSNEEEAMAICNTAKLPSIKTDGVIHSAIITKDSQGNEQPCFLPKTDPTKD